MRFWLTAVCRSGMSLLCLIRPIAGQNRAAQLEAQRLDQQMSQLYLAGRYDEAIPLAERVIAILERTSAKEHPDTAKAVSEDGVLTALEVSGLDLWGTKLVVLSACETGLGYVKNGEGVYGLRRALVLAGSETQVMSLWKVSDSGTRDLMTAYYTRLKQGEGRAEALRQVQLTMLRGQRKPTAGRDKRGTVDAGEKVVATDYRHPYYWAAFIQSGDWRNLMGK